MVQVQSLRYLNEWNDVLQYTFDVYEINTEIEIYIDHLIKVKTLLLQPLLFSPNKTSVLHFLQLQTHLIQIINFRQYDQILLALLADR